MCNDEVAVQANLTEAEARALMCLMEVGAKEIRRKLDSGEYPHECQKNIAEGVLARGVTMQAGIMRVLAKHAGVLQ